MKRYEGDLTEMVGVRFSKKGLSKLDHIAAMARLERSDVIRRLVELARARPAMGVSLRGPIVEESDSPMNEVPEGTASVSA